MAIDKFQDAAVTSEAAPVNEQAPLSLPAEQDVDFPKQGVKNTKWGPKAGGGA